MVDQIGQSCQRSASSVSGTSTVSCQSVSYQASFRQLSLVSNSGVRRGRGDASARCQIERRGGVLRRGFCDVEKATFGSASGSRGCLAASGRCDFWSRFGHVLRRGARHTPVSRCQIERRGGVLERLFCDVEKATFGSCFAKDVTPAGGGQKHTPPLLCAINAKSREIELMID